MAGRKDEYIDLLYGVSSRGAGEDWMKFFFEVLALSCRRTTDSIERIVGLRDAYHHRLREASRSPNTAAVADALFEMPYIDVSRVRDVTGISDPAARKILGILVRMGILLEVDMYPKFWVAPEILEMSRP